MSNPHNKSNPLTNRLPQSLSAAAILCLTLGLSQNAFPEGGGLVSEDESSFSAVTKVESYSPYAERNFPNLPLWGDTHLHTSLSFDAGAFGATLLPPDAYRFAKGEEVISSHGMPVRLSRPLDFLVVAEHSDNMGFFPNLRSGAAYVMASETGKRWHELLNEGGQAGVTVASEMIQAFAQGKFPNELKSLPGTSVYRSTWDSIINAAEEANDPGRFTAFIGYEWTSLTKGNNLHRVVVYRDDADRAKLLEPFGTTPPLGSVNPIDLWKWMDRYEEKTAGQVLAIAHNGNLSNGIMFPEAKAYTGKKIGKWYAKTRAFRERIYEVTQIKGDGETHPLLSKNDEFADYETWEVGNLDLSVGKTTEMLAGEYAREALKSGLRLEARLGTNPYKFGLIGSTDSHTALATAQEDNFFGKHAGYEPSPTRMNHDMMSGPAGTVYGWAPAASGLAAVWATENSRTAIFDAMERKEVYATTGSRLAVRFFGGWEFTDQDINSRQPAFAGYTKGVPMGRDLPARPSGASAPTFMVYSLRDAQGANLDRIQIVKGWLGDDGRTREQVFDVAWSDGRRMGSDGKLPPVGNTVDVENANWTNTIGASELGTVWTDPDFDPDQEAFYYARVIEIPTPRWSTYDAFRFGVDIPEDAPTSTQERAYTSPIWYTPGM